MATFRCGKCGCDEDTALCNYWSARVRDKLPVCSACDPKIAKWHGQFPRIFGIFLVTPSHTNRPVDTLGNLLGRLSLAEAGPKLAAANERTTETGEETRGGRFYPDDPVP